MGTALGFFWWLLDPLLLAAVYVFVVSGVLGRGGPDYPVFVVTSIVAWKYFQSGVRNGISATLSKERQMRHSRFPRSIIPLSSLLAETVRFVFAFVVVVAVAVGYGIAPHPTLAFVPLIIAVQFIFSLALAVPLAALNIFYRDILHITGPLFRAWFFLSPALYPLSAVPENHRDLYQLNPFAVILPAYHSVVLDHQVPDVAALGIVAGASFGLLVGAFLLFVRLQSSFAKVN